MRQCTTCGRTYPNEVEECEYDGSPLFHIGDSVEEEEAAASATQLPESNPFSNESGIPPALRASAQNGAVSTSSPDTAKAFESPLRQSAGLGSLPTPLASPGSFGSLPSPTPSAPATEPLRASLAGSLGAPPNPAVGLASSGISPTTTSSAGNLPATGGPPAGGPPSFPSSLPPSTPGSPGRPNTGGVPAGGPPSRPPSKPTPARPAREPDTKSLLAGIDQEINNLKEPEPIAPTYEPSMGPPGGMRPPGGGFGPPPSLQEPSFGGAPDPFSAPSSVARSSRIPTPNDFPAFSDQTFPPMKKQSGGGSLKTVIIILVVVAILILIGVLFLFVLK